MEGPSSGLNIVIGGGEDDHHDYIMDLPPGFRFHPTDEEIITHYLTQKVMNSTFCARAVGEVDLNKCEPWDLPKKAKMGEKEWYFFCQRDRKYPTGMRTNRATESGYWKATGKDKEIYKKGRGGGSGGGLVGMKKTLVFYKGRAPKGEKTNWVMHEYRLEGQFSYYNFPKPAKDEWVVCRVFHKNTGLKRGPISPSETRMNSFVDDFFDSPSLPPLMEPPNYSNVNEIQAPGSSFTDGEDDTKGKATASSSSARSSDGGDYLSYFSMDLNNVKNHFMMPNSTNYNNNNSYQASLMISSSNPPTLDSIFQSPIHFPMSNVRPFESYPSLGHSNQDRMGGPPSFTGYSNDRTILQALKVGATASTEIDDHDQKQYCKTEQLSSTQDTGCLSGGDMTTAETSSVISKKDKGSNSNISNYHEDLEDPTSVDPISDNLDYLWNY